MDEKERRSLSTVYEQYLLKEQALLRENLKKFSPFARFGVIIYSCTLIYYYIVAPFQDGIHLTRDSVYIFGALLLMYQAFEVVSRMVDRSYVRDIACVSDDVAHCDEERLSSSFLERLARRALPFHGLHGLLFSIWNSVAFFYLILSGMGYFGEAYPAYFFISYATVTLFYLLDLILKGVFIWRIPDYLITATLHTLVRTASGDIFYELIRGIFSHRLKNGKV